MIIDSQDGTRDTAPWPTLRPSSVPAPPRAPIRKRSRRLPFALVVADSVGMLLAVLVVQQAFDAGLAAVPIVLLLNASGGLYQRRLAMSVLDDTMSLATRGCVAILLALAVAASFQAPLPFTGIIAGLVAAAAIYVVIVLVARALLYEAVRRARRGGQRPVIILGAGKIADRVASRLLERPEYGLRPVGCVDSLPLIGAERRSVPLLGGTKDLAETIVEYRAYDVIVAFGSFREHEVLDGIDTCRRLGCEVFCVPRFFELQGVRGTMVENLWGMPIVRLPRRPHVSPAWRVKRAMDVVGAGIGLLLASPVMAACALAVRLDGGPGVLFRQNRVGIDGRSFTVLKFRSMRPATEDESATRWNIAQDDRLGPIGKFLRQTSLDELPQLWNILRGDMSLVGPRPERPHFVAEFTQAFPGYGSRHRVPAGLTGLAQVNGLRGDTSIEERARFDNLYIENWSLWQDVKIIMQTVLAPLRRSGG